MGNFWRQLRSFVLISIITATGALAEDSGDVVWKPTSTSGEIAFTKTLLALSGDSLPDGVSSASCRVTVAKPSFDTPAVKTGGNLAICVYYSSDNGVGEARWDLSDEVIEPWGNRSGPFGFSVKGPAAERLYEAMRKVYAADRQANPYLNSKEVSFPGVGLSYSYTEQLISTKPRRKSGETTGPAALTCARYYLHAIGQTRPEEPIHTRCDFIL